MTAAVAVRGVSKRYRLGLVASDSLREAVASLWRPRAATEWFWALQDIDLEVQQGEVLGIIGRNGAGKSTLLKLLSRITVPTRGEIEIRGRVGSLLEVGAGFHPELTGRENVFLNGTLLGMTRHEVRARFDEIVSFSGVEKFLDTPVKHYSSGMYVRLAFAVAAHLEPEILLVDEVLAVGDGEFQKKCLGKMGAVASEGRTVVFVTHNMQAVATLCGRAVQLEDGRVAAQGPPGKVVARYLSAVQPGVLEQSWPAEAAPGANGVRFRRVAVKPRTLPGDEPLIDVSTPLDIECEFWNDRPGTSTLNLSLHLLAEAGECVFNVGSEVVQASPGPLRGVCHVPGHLLNDGLYHIRLMVVRDTTTILADLERAVSIEVGDRREGVSYFGPWPGYVRPKLAFSLRPWDE